MPRLKEGDGADCVPSSAAAAPLALARSSRAALARPAPRFARFIGVVAPSNAAGATALPAAGGAPAPSTRHYPQAALAFGQAGISMAASGELLADVAARPAAKPAAADPAADAGENLTPAGPLPQAHSLLGRPQAWLRPSVPAPRPAAPVSLQLLEEVAVAAHVGGGRPGEGASFAIVFREELLGELQCTVHVAPHGAITATFAGADAQTARLLGAEAGRLRRQFAARGLPDVHIVVVKG